jgi:hypothetical protein
MFLFISPVPFPPSTPPRPPPPSSPSSSVKLVLCYLDANLSIIQCLGATLVLFRWLFSFGLGYFRPGCLGSGSLGFGSCLSLGLWCCFSVGRRRRGWLRLERANRRSPRVQSIALLDRVGSCPWTGFVVNPRELGLQLLCVGYGVALSADLHLVERGERYSNLMKVLQLGETKRGFRIELVVRGSENPGIDIIVVSPSARLQLWVIGKPDFVDDLGLSGLCVSNTPAM